VPLNVQLVLLMCSIKSGYILACR